MKVVLKKAPKSKRLWGIFGWNGQI